MPLGKLKKTLKEMCPYCKVNFQVRVVKAESYIRGEKVLVDQEAIICPNCEFEYNGRDREKILKNGRNKKFKTIAFGSESDW